MARTKGAADKKQRNSRGPMSAAAVERQQASRQATERDTRRREKEQAERDRPAATFFRLALSLDSHKIQRVMKTQQQWRQQ